MAEQKTEKAQHSVNVPRADRTYQVRPVAALWTCAAHGVTTTGDCPRCDDELIALAETDDSAAASARCFYCRRGACHSCVAGDESCGCCDPGECPCSLGTPPSDVEGSQPVPHAYERDHSAIQICTCGRPHDHPCHDAYRVYTPSLPPVKEGPS